MPRNSARAGTENGTCSCSHGRPTDFSLCTQHSETRAIVGTEARNSALRAASACTLCLVHIRAIKEPPLPPPRLLSLRTKVQECIRSREIPTLQTMPRGPSRKGFSPLPECTAAGNCCAAGAGYKRVSEGGLTRALALRCSSFVCLSGAITENLKCGRCPRRSVVSRNPCTALSSYACSVTAGYKRPVGKEGAEELAQ